MLVSLGFSALYLLYFNTSYHSVLVKWQCVFKDGNALQIEVTSKSTMNWKVTDIIFLYFPKKSQHVDQLALIRGKAMQLK